MAFSFTSTAFESQEQIPARYTCDGDNVSPPLSRDGVPPDAAALALQPERLQ